MELYKNVSQMPEELPGGRMLGPGETCLAFEDNYIVKRCVEEGKFIAIEMPATQDAGSSDSGGHE